MCSCNSSKLNAPREDFSEGFGGGGRGGHHSSHRGGWGRSSGSVVYSGFNPYYYGMYPYDMNYPRTTQTIVEVKEPDEKKLEEKVEKAVNKIQAVKAENETATESKFNTNNMIVMAVMSILVVIIIILLLTRKA